MRLTADLINASLSYLNPLKERELDLRGHKIPAIENLGVAKDHDALDLTDNDIASLSNFPLSPRLSTLLLARNRITLIQPNLAQSIPNLSTLVLSGNRIAELADLDPLSGFAKLTHLIVLDNPVTAKEHYREWLLWRCPQVRFLDYVRVTDAERKRGQGLFGSASQPTQLAERILGRKTLSKTFDVPASMDDVNAATSVGKGIMRLKLTPKERKRMEQLIRNTTTSAELDRLQKDLDEGRLPASVIAATADDNDDDEEMTG